MNSTAVNAAMERALGKALKSNLLLRFLSAAILAPAFYFIVEAGDLAFASLMLLGALWAGYEWLMMVNPRGQKAVWVPVLFSLALSWGVALQTDIPTSVILCLSVSLVLMVLFRIFKVQKPVLLSMSVSYIGSAMLGLLAMRQIGPAGFSLTVFVCAAVWLTDTGAYFCGRILRGVRLAPDISPSKTWAGFIGGIGAALLTAGLFIALFHPHKPYGVLAVAGFLSLSAQCGDLFESWVKRQAGVKDSGELIPGHGGLLDRIDGLIMAVLLFWAALWATHNDLSWWV
ncbi:MAG: phosphatidate cytidylyltransferase [Proteobacteria bacterium]|nr:phosphatidate cytidylyltransferase [Pseudomonadota bacterium]